MESDLQGSDVHEHDFIDLCAAELTDLLAQLTDPIDDDGRLGERVLERALEVYRAVLSKRRV